MFIPKDLREYYIGILKFYGKRGSEMMTFKHFTRKYFIMGSQDVPEDKDPVDILNQAVQAGVTAFEFRELGDDQLFGSDKLHLATELRKICKQNNIPFIVNNDIDMLHLMNADGIRVDQQYVDIHSLRERLPDKIIGLTMSREDQEDGGQMALVDFVAIGPVYESLPHIKKEQPIGLDLTKQISATYPTINVVSFGGIDTTNAKDVMDAGASGVGVIHGITEAQSIDEAVDQL